MKGTNDEKELLLKNINLTDNNEIIPQENLIDLSPKGRNIVFIL